MGRPNKNNAEYFSHDADMRNDIKIKALRRRFSHTGYAVWCYLLETLTDTDFFEVDYGELNQELLAADFDVSVEELQNIIEYSCKINLLQLSEDGKKLYSETHKRRFSVLVTKRERDRERIARLPNNKNKINKDIIATKKELSNDYRNENPHSKVKYSKEEYSKEKNIYNYHYIVERWNETCGICLPKVKTLNESRRQKIKLRLQEFGDSEAAQMEVLNTLLDKIVASSFLKGDNNNSWTATFDWLFENSKNWVKIIEGNYDDNRGLKNNAKQVNNAGINLGIGEYIEQATGRRTYGTGKATIPHDAPARPSERHSWDAGSQSWIII